MAEPRGERRWSGTRILARTAGIALVYFAAGRLGLLIPIAENHVTLLWAPTGLALAAALRFGPAAIPGIALGAFLVNFTVGGGPGLALGIACGNTLEAAAGAWLLRKAGFRNSLERVRDVLLLIALGVLLAPIVSATLGAASLAAAGLLPRDRGPWNVAGYWWLGDAMGALLVTPVLLTWAELPLRLTLRGKRVLEAAVLGLGLFVASDLTLRAWVDSPFLHPPLAFTLFPFLVWAALRFGRRGASTATLLAVGIAVWATLQGLSPFARGTLDERLIYLHTYMAVAAVTSLLLAAILAERKGAVAGLRESEERLRLALGAGRCGVWDWDIANERLTWSERLFEFHGIDPRDFKGRLEDFSSLVHPEDAERVSAAIQQALRSGEDYELEFRIVRPDGQVRWLMTSGRAIYDQNDRPVRMLGATLDMTERREAEEERTRLLAREREARAEAEAANEAKDRFLATLSHELRTPLTPVLAVVSALEENDQVPPGLARPLDTIRRNVELEARLIDDLLDLTRIVRGKLELHPEVTDARKIVEHTIEICCEREVEAGRLRLAEDLAAEDHRIWADPSRLTQVMWNLLSNAVKFTPAGGTVTVRSWNEGDRLVLQVSDTGVGIDPEVLPHVFDAFEQGKARSPRGMTGLGLGLAISKAIVEMHGGDLTAASEGRGRGATFTVSLPATLPAQTGEISIMGEGLDETWTRRPRVEDLHILLVEDHADTAEAMADLLSLMGHRVVTAGTVAEALAAAGRERFDLVVSDLGLPDGSGLDVMGELSRRYNLPGIALSGYGMEEDVRRSHEAGFSRHLTKPVGLPALEAAIRKTVQERLAQR
ncbi:MAG TPA: MASE1 domain-containing protein [Thermoanaerobaculia bacterium]|jgi:PAS domain S-box-containing protein|nr:MASE1 domain-containing protein [Thermoanaerobaculia bacterium]